jgi:hypothetical protein
VLWQALSSYSGVQQELDAAGEALDNKPRVSIFSKSKLGCFAVLDHKAETIMSSGKYGSQYVSRREFRGTMRNDCGKDYASVTIKLKLKKGFREVGVVPVDVGYVSAGRTFDVLYTVTADADRYEITEVDAR